MMKCKIMVIKEIFELWKECRPEAGKVYDARYYPAIHNKCGNRNNESCVINVAGKHIILREGEFAFVDG
jgi:hypothetical protein